MSDVALNRLGERLGVRPGYAQVPAGVFGSGIGGLYVHVPFCSTKCHYCDFYSIAGHLDQADDFLAAMEVEVGLWREKVGLIRPATVFVGGGTPTLLDAGRLERLLGILRGGMAAGWRPAEFTVEANPNTFDSERARVLVGGGVNRISFGAQSFVGSELVTLQRDHDPENVGKAFEMARRAGIGNINVDLIFGIPGQTLETWEYSLERALGLSGGGGPEHMSCYSLTYEPNTAMTARMKRGEFSVIDEELELSMFEHVYARMRGAGFGRYEVSNYARAGKECRHNVLYWKGGNWMAWGPAAAGHLDGFRWKNVGSLNHYMEALGGAKAELPLTQVEQLSARNWAGEVAVFWLRLSEGLSYGEFFGRTRVDARPVLERVLKGYAEMGFVELLHDRARLTEKAVAVSNRILADVLAGFEEPGD